MKKLSLLVLGLALFMACPQILSASAVYGGVTITTTAGGTLIASNVANTTVSPTTYTAKSCIPAGVIITKIFAYCNTYASAGAWQLWDCPSGGTGTAGAKEVFSAYIPASAAAGTAVYDFCTSASMRTDEDGLYFRYFPVWVNANANTVTAMVEYRPWTAPTQSGAAK